MYSFVDALPRGIVAFRLNLLFAVTLSMRSNLPEVIHVELLEGCFARSKHAVNPSQRFAQLTYQMVAIVNGTNIVGMVGMYMDTVHSYVVLARGGGH